MKIGIAGVEYDMPVADGEGGRYTRVVRGPYAAPMAGLTPDGRIHSLVPTWLGSPEQAEEFAAALLAIAKDTRDRAQSAAEEATR